MQSAIVFLAVLGAVSAGIVSPVAYSAGPSVLTRAPQFDSAVIKSDRLGGNFAYSVAESHAYAKTTPIVQHVTSPVAVSYTAQAPVVSYSAPAVQTIAASPYAASPYAVPAYGYPYGFAPAAYANYGYNYPLAYNTFLKK